MYKITNMSVEDVRYPTSKDKTGSDAIHTNPNYSATYIKVYTSDVNLTGFGITFTLGKGNDIVASCIKNFFSIFINMSLEELEKNIGKLWYECAEHSQLRWLGPEKGVVHLAVSAIFNALWDLISKKNKKPLWKFVIESEPKTIISWLVFKHIDDVLSKEEALEILTQSQK